MAERKAVNKYYPPDWDPRKGSVNKRVGQHPLRDRAKKLSQGILVIRFELPYNIWCGGCGIHVGMGVRYNAEKSKVGNYYTTPIYKFRMKCHLCDNYFEIQTDPKNHDYVILNGARRKEQRWDPVANGQIMPEDKATQKKLATDPMYKLEHGSDDHQKGREQVTSLAQLEETRISMIDDYLLNRMARDKFRSEKRQLKEAAEADKAILDKASLDIDLVEESEEDRRLAGLLRYSVTTSFEDKQKEKRKSIEQKPLFVIEEDVSVLSASPLTSSTSASTSSSSSSSSSSRLLSQALPYQRHVKPKLSRRGEIKQKLGWAIKASYKDPFKSAGKKDDTVYLSGPANAMQKQLGIKLKSSPQDKQLPSSRTLTTNCGSRSSDHATFSKGKIDSSIHQRDACENEMKDEEQLETEAPSLCTNSVHQIPSADVDADPQKEPSPVSKSPGLAVNLPTHDPTSDISLGETGAPDSSTCSNKEGSESCVGALGSKSNNSGLLTLMSSYVDSDSNSSD